MKLYSTPVPYNPTGYKNWQADEANHLQQLKSWLKDRGYTGKSGEILRMPVADGYALYMLAEGGPGGPFLIHLPYGDAYQYMGIEHFPKSKVLELIEQNKRLQALFDKGRQKT